MIPIWYGRIRWPRIASRMSIDFSVDHKAHERSANARQHSRSRLADLPFEKIRVARC